MECAACQTPSNYTFCEACLAWLMASETEQITIDLYEEEDE